MIHLSDNKDNGFERLLLDIQARQCEMLESLGEMKSNIEAIKTHTETMNSELGSCEANIKACQGEIIEIKKKPILNISWKQLVTAIGAISAIIVIVQVLIQIFHI